LIHELKYRVLEQLLVVCRLAAGAPIPSWATEGEFFCVARTRDEVSVVCSEEVCPDGAPEQTGDGIKVEHGWVALKLEGPFPFAMTGVLAAVLSPLAEGKIPIFAISTFDTDYVLLKATDLEGARQALRAAGHQEIAS
jgi:uncharacterized protein